VITVFRSLRHSVVRARDLRDRGEIFVGGDEQAIVLRKLAAFGLVACSVSIGMHLPNLFCEFRQRYATTLLSLVKRFVMVDFLYTAKRRTVFPESSIYKADAVIACRLDQVGIIPEGDASQAASNSSLQDRIIRTFDRFRNATKPQKIALFR
jgi:hypothetical protein